GGRAGEPLRGTGGRPPPQGRLGAGGGGQRRGARRARHRAAGQTTPDRTHDGSLPAPAASESNCRSTNSTWPRTSLRRAVSVSNQAALSISGNDWIRPERGGHSIVNVLLTACVA